MEGMNPINSKIVRCYHFMSVGKFNDWAEREPHFIITSISNTPEGVYVVCVEPQKKCTKNLFDAKQKTVQMIDYLYLKLEELSTEDQKKVLDDIKITLTS